MLTTLSRQRNYLTKYKFRGVEKGGRNSNKSQNYLTPFFCYNYLLRVFLLKFIDFRNIFDFLVWTENRHLPQEV